MGCGRAQWCREVYSRIVHVSSQVLRAHDVVGATVGLACDYRQLRHRSLRVREQQLTFGDRSKGGDG